jgi:hypothetical protein
MYSRTLIQKVPTHSWNLRPGERAEAKGLGGISIIQLKSSTVKPHSAINTHRASWHPARYYVKLIESLQQPNK